MKAKRIDLIKEYILENEHVSLKELEDTFNVSMNTIRRDIAQLLEDPRFEKVYGGISVKKNQLISFENRNTENQEVKQAIAETAAQFIQNGDLIYIDSGTTTKYILDYLDKDIQITIITNSLDVILRAEKFKNISVFVFGNIFKKTTRSFVGLPSEQVVNRYNITKSFMAATAVSIENGLMNSDIMEYELKKHIVEKAEINYLLVHADKFDKSTLLTYAPLSAIDTIITDKQFDDSYTSYFENNNIDVLTVD
ncbi:hypothetical protein RV11_GL002792 [Enterococcus phoeniculicola]|jgi:DeoR family myo-inositol catabolism operon transcriptional repressor|uniref:HTH deoR-type domain-containing protein n=1 Tax=Enterococcus phoeniculicola ATCC BAA-412 TaxID=1158610 RepID=R3W2L0_9ENTE|nr:DeoR/GlpR family DNA-binding transcription regulator [Enterococcus phoeniculicola]EOL41686.1 hypothetical protein UC3_03251 [Enterococcus phoeniculicola ATCC BAA-412]EOT78820.1 hypothetical protein I589_00325 [Enterococcus phoeniculicola ATCC BAA-412]OJG72653.1 hypothetical protein RV11_GL002792 [Enterococcus phoeniculicola]